MSSLIAGSRRGSRANTPKRESKGGRQSLEKAVLEKAIQNKAKRGAGEYYTGLLFFLFGIFLLQKETLPLLAGLTVL